MKTAKNEDYINDEKMDRNDASIWAKIFAQSMDNQSRRREQQIRLDEETQNKSEEQIRKLIYIIKFDLMWRGLTELPMRKKRYGCIGIGDLFSTNQIT